LQPFMGSQMLLMIAIMLLVMAVGTAMDMTPTILILTPVLMPVVKAAGIDPVYFGVLFIINNAIGLITPPVGTVLNTVAGVGRIKMDDVTRGMLPFMWAEFAMMFLMVLFPQLVTAKSGGRIKINLFPGGVLGGDQANVSALQGGTLDMVVLNSGILASQVKEFGVYDFPFIFANPKEADAVVDGPFGKMMHQK